MDIEMKVLDHKPDRLSSREVKLKRCLSAKETLRLIQIVVAGL